MKLLLDMNLSPTWVQVLEGAGFEAIHWASIGLATADDAIIFRYARANSYTIVTQDLDFGTMLAITKASLPSVIQIRREDLDPISLGPVLLDVLDRYKGSIEEGALIVIDERTIRLRILPL